MDISCYIPGQFTTGERGTKILDLFRRKSAVKKVKKTGASLRDDGMPRNKWTCRKCGDTNSFGVIVCKSCWTHNYLGVFSLD